MGSTGECPDDAFWAANPGREEPWVEEGTSVAPGCRAPGSSYPSVGGGHAGWHWLLSSLRSRLQPLGPWRPSGNENKHANISRKGLGQSVIPPWWVQLSEEGCLGPGTAGSRTWRGTRHPRLCGPAAVPAVGSAVTGNPADGGASGPSSAVGAAEEYGPGDNRALPVRG